ncbi:DNA ligase [Catenovulum agarivorans]|uniref:DNA ligase n=1 Tax=Catenovulum agarivorans TaxID=1172192 RepID=UPI0002F38CE5|nr:DNA ligase [Catenovulum agarivorans]
MFPRSLSFILFVVLLTCGYSIQAKPIDLMLAEKYSTDIKLSDYLVSEKYDGVRAYWDGKQFWTRQGNPINPPASFVADFPNRPLDGELWLGHNQFADLMSIIHDATDPRWQQVSFMVFDLPDLPVEFSARYQKMLELMQQLPSNSSIKIVEQFDVNTHQKLQTLLNQYVNNGAEGLMLHKKSALYRGKRSDDLIKVKKFTDAEAKVIEYIAGKGQFTGLVGALLVEDLLTGKQFKIGSGLSKAQRANPPAIGSIITYKFTGLTKNELPRFPVFLRIRSEGF